MAPTVSPAETSLGQPSSTGEPVDVIVADV